MSPILAPLALLAALAAAPAADDEGFTPLFDGKSLEGWTTVGGKADNWAVENGLLVTRGDGGGWLSTDATYANFTLRLEYKLQEGGNSGVFIRSPRSGDPAYTGMEIQVLDNEADRYKNLQPYQYSGSVYGVMAAERGHTKPAGEWNSMEITADKLHITIKINGHTVVDDNLRKHPDAVEKHPGMKRRDGYIGLQSHSEPVLFRNIRIKPLP
jgi:hypothetical protein